jgi:hypothetical protein
MMNRAVLVLGLGLLIPACGVGDNGLPSTPEARTCLANLSITGTFTLGMPSPDVVNNDTQLPPADGIPDILGCWPTGTWAFTAAVVDNTCATAPTPLAEYKFVAAFVDDPIEPTYSYTLVTPDPATNDNRVHISSGGGGLCEGTLELYSADGLQSWNLHPALNVFNTSGPLTGIGEYAEWKEPQYP